MPGTITKARVTQFPVSCSPVRKAAKPQVDIVDEFEYKAACPVCGKRVFDLSDLPSTPVRVRLKCPHCRKIVKIPFAGASP